MTTMASQITSLMVFYSTQLFIQTQVKGNIKAQRYWPVCGEFTGPGEFPAQRASYEENVSIRWRHHDVKITLHKSSAVANCTFSDRYFVYAEFEFNLINQKRSTNKFVKFMDMKRLNPELL